MKCRPIKVKMYPLKGRTEPVRKSGHQMLQTLPNFSSKTRSNLPDILNEKKELKVRRSTDRMSTPTNNTRNCDNSTQVAFPSFDITNENIDEKNLKSRRRMVLQKLSTSTVSNFVDDRNEERDTSDGIGRIRIRKFQPRQQRKPSIDLSGLSSVSDDSDSVSSANSSQIHWYI